MARRLRQFVLFLISAALVGGTVLFAGDPVLRTWFEAAAIAAFALGVF